MSELIFTFSDGSGSVEKCSDFEAGLQGKRWWEILALQQFLPTLTVHQQLLMLYYIELDPEAPPVMLMDGKLVILRDITSQTTTSFGTASSCGGDPTSAPSSEPTSSSRCSERKEFFEQFTQCGSSSVTTIDGTALLSNTSETLVIGTGEKEREKKDN